MTTVSVIIPTYNRLDSLGRAIDSVRAQSFQAWELVVVDDGSPSDATSQLVHRYMNQDLRIRYVRQPHSGSYQARNTGICHAKGKYVAFLDDDDEWMPEKLTTQVAFMKSHHEVGLCYMFFQIYRKGARGVEASKRFPHGPVEEFEELLGAFIAPSSVLIRKVCLDQIAWFNPEFPISADFDLWLRFVQRWPIRAIDQVGTLTVMDDRVREGQSELAARMGGIRVLQNLKLMPDYKRYRRFVTRQIARRYYLIGRIYVDEKKFWQAAKHFALAVLTDPLVGLTIRKPGEEGWKLIFRVLKSYLAAPGCLWRGVMYAKR